MEKTKERNSSIELLRIICMFIIIAYHYVLHGKMINSDLCYNEMYMRIFSLGGPFANTIFILIMGYFMINSDFKVKKFLKLITKMLFYGFLIAIIYISFEKNINADLFSHELMPLVYGGWFIVTYIIMYLISPFLNKMIKSLKKKDFQKLLIIIVFIWSIIPTIMNYYSNYSNLDVFLVIYMIGAYIRLYDNEKENNKRNLQLGVLFGGILIIRAIILTLIENSSFSIKSEYDSIYYTLINNVLTLLSSIFIFRYFKNINFVSSKINWISKNILGVYLIHDDNIVRPYLWNEFLPNYLYKNSKFLMVHFIFKILIVFTGCIIIDKIVEFILNKTLYKIINKKNFKNVENKIFKIE